MKYEPVTFKKFKCYFQNIHLKHKEFKKKKLTHISLERYTLFGVFFYRNKFAETHRLIPFDLFNCPKRNTSSFEYSNIAGFEFRFFFGQIKAPFINYLYTIQIILTISYKTDKTTHIEVFEIEKHHNKINTYYKEIYKIMNIFQCND